jgi:hypothetical protein
MGGNGQSTTTLKRTSGWLSRKPSPSSLEEDGEDDKDDEEGSKTPGRSLIDDSADDGNGVGGGASKTTAVERAGARKEKAEAKATAKLALVDMNVEANLAARDAVNRTAIATQVAAIKRDHRAADDGGDAHDIVEVGRGRRVLRRCCGVGARTTRPRGISDDRVDDATQTLRRIPSCIR